MAISAHAVDRGIVLIELRFVAVVVARARKESEILVESSRARGQSFRQAEMPDVNINLYSSHGGVTRESYHFPDIIFR